MMRWCRPGSGACVSHHRSRNCSNSRTIRRDDIERRALAGITDRLVSADKIDAAVAAYAAHINRENRQQRIAADADRSEEHTSELQSLMRISYAVFCLKKKSEHNNINSR